MHGTIPPPAPAAVNRFERLTPVRAGVSVKKVFGQPAAFVNGNMFMGVFGSQIFVRLSDEACRAALQEPGVRPFEPMAGRAMRGYVVLPDAILNSDASARRWVSRSLGFAEGLPPKAPKRKPR